MTKRQYNNACKIFLQKHFDLTEFVPKAIFHTMNMWPKQMHEKRKKYNSTPDISLRPPQKGKKSQN
jgi:hypothetical protein